MLSPPCVTAGQVMSSVSFHLMQCLGFRQKVSSWFHLTIELCFILTWMNFRCLLAKLPAGGWAPALRRIIIVAQNVFLLKEINPTLDLRCNLWKWGKRGHPESKIMLVYCSSAEKLTPSTTETELFSSTSSFLFLRKCHSWDKWSMSRRSRVV